MSLRAFAGAPFVLALSPRPGAAYVLKMLLADLRADLRGLGPALLVISPDGVWCFHPDDSLEPVAERSELCDVELAGVFADYGVATDGDDGSSDPALYVIDHELRVVLERSRGTASDMTDLVEALASSRRATVAPAASVEATARAHDLPFAFEEGSVTT